MRHLVEFQQVSFQYGAGASLNDLSFAIDPGEFVAIIGENGAGKSTLVKLFNGLLKPAQGAVVVDGDDTRKVRTSQLAQKIGFLFQNPDRQICQSTIREEILFGLRLAGISPQEQEERVESTLEAFGFDGARDPFTMSRGERQRIALATLLAIRPALMILDEPTTGLDYRECMHIMELIRQQNEQGTAVVMVTHDMEIVQDFARRVLVLSHGRLLKEGSMANVMYDQEVLGQASLLPPQIPGLSLLLGKEFQGIFNVSDMTRAIMQRRDEHGRLA